MKQALIIPNPDYLSDHIADGQSVLPAVEALAYLARVAHQYDQSLSTSTSSDANFLRFVKLPDEGAPLGAEVELSEERPGELRASLSTRARLGTSQITRSLEHVTVTYGAAWNPELPPWDRLCALTGVCCSFSSEWLYGDLVPFGPSFHNAQGRISLAPSGAVGLVHAPEYPAPDELLGSPFPLDSAFHLACAWGQRFAGKLTFPTGYARRAIVRACVPAQTYFCRVIPVEVTDDALLFDLWIFDLQGDLREVACGVRMQEVFKKRGKLAADGPLTSETSPLDRIVDWVQKDLSDPFVELRKKCLGLSVVELDSMAPFVDKALTERERARFEKMAPKRQSSFCSARIALKQLARSLCAEHEKTAAQTLETSADDDKHPLCPVSAGHAAKYTAVSHDTRFCIALASQHPVGVDVEQLSERVQRGRRLFLSEAEQIRVDVSSLGPVAAAVRIWTIKEAAAKALDVPLAQAFSMVEVVWIGENECIADVDGRRMKVPCVAVDDHVFSMLVMD